MFLLLTHFKNGKMIPKNTTTFFANHLILQGHLGAQLFTSLKSNLFQDVK